MDALNLSILKLSNLDDQTKAEAFQVYIDCFPVYHRISKNKKMLRDFFMDSFDFNLTYAAVMDTKVMLS